jgi:4'-phosphopantetheinyl transferase
MIAWLIQSLPDLPATTEWLTAEERSRLAAFRFEKRRREWLLGRWTAKRLIQAVVAQAGLTPVPLGAFEIQVAPDGAPLALWRRPGGARRFALSLSHSHGSALGALLPSQPRALGADLERIAPREAAFAGDYFTLAEQAQVMCASPRLHDTLVTALWSAKEAALKAARLGLTVDARAVECRLAPPSAALSSWAAFDVRWDRGRLPDPPPLQGWWRLANGFVLTLAAGQALSGGAT